MNNIFVGIMANSHTGIKISKVIQNFHHVLPPDYSFLEKHSVLVFVLNINLVKSFHVFLGGAAVKFFFPVFFFFKSVFAWTQPLNQRNQMCLSRYTLTILYLSQQLNIRPSVTALYWLHHIVTLHLSLCVRVWFPASTSLLPLSCYQGFYQNKQIPSD